MRLISCISSATTNLSPEGLDMKATMKLMLSATMVIGAGMMTAPAAAAQSTGQKIETTVHKATKTTKHNLKHLGHETKRTAKTTARAASNAVVGHKILCEDGTWASRDNPDCHGHDGVAKRQPGDHDK
jgi:hypothetical protein